MSPGNLLTLFGGSEFSADCFEGIISLRGILKTLSGPLRRQTLTQVLTGTRRSVNTASLTRLGNFNDVETVLHEGRQVAICLPWYKTTNPLTAFSVMGLIDRTRTKVLMRFGDAFIAHTRNLLAEEFLRTGMEFQLVVDDDMVLPFANAALYRSFTGFSIADKFAGLHTIDRLLSHGKTLVGAFYCGRWPGGKPVYAEAQDNPEELKFAMRGPHDICRVTRWIGTGCLLVHRSVYLDVEKRFPHLARHPDTGKDGNFFTPDGGDIRGPFREAIQVLNDSGNAENRLAKAVEILEAAERRVVKHGLGVGEDVSFCLRAADAGHPAHVDLGLWCGHVGSAVYPKILKDAR